MKTIVSLAAFYLTLAASTQGQVAPTIHSPSLTPPPDLALPEPTPFGVVQRGPHHKVFERVVYEYAPPGRVVPRKHRYSELATGLHYVAADGSFAESDSSFEVTPDGYAIARHCQHQAIVSPTLNPTDGVVVDLQMPDGQRLRSGILGLTLADRVSGRTLQVASVKDCVGQQTATNEITFFDAFEGLKADVRIRNERGCFHQEVLLNEKLTPDQLARLGFNDPSTVNLEAWTEFVEAPNPTVTPFLLSAETNAVLRAVMAEPDVFEEFVGFPAMKFGRGEAFVRAAAPDSPVVRKRWVESGSRRFLVESIAYSDLLPLTGNLPASTIASVSQPGSGATHLLARNSPPRRAKSGGQSNIRIAALERSRRVVSGPQVTLDYVLLNGTLTNWVFAGDSTTFISDQVNLGGTSNVLADLHLITEGSLPATNAPGVISYWIDGSAAVFRVGSGTFQFSAQQP